MFGKISGRVDSVYDDHVIIDAGGVGYIVFCSTKALSAMQNGAFQSLFIETHVREDHINLYGFLSLSEKQIFQTLTKVNGVGNKMALSILSKMNEAEIYNTINSKNHAILQQVPGIGPKLAQRIVNELQGKFTGATSIEVGSNTNQNILNEAASALINLGVNKSESYNIVYRIFETDPNIDVNELIRKSLKEMVK